MKKEDRMYKLENGTETAKWAYKHIKQLEEYIEILGVRYDHCTFGITHTVCTGCECPRSKKPE